MPEPITKEWLESVGFIVSEKPDRRRSAQRTGLFLHLPFHLTILVAYWEAKDKSVPDTTVVSTVTADTPWGCIVEMADELDRRA